LLHGLLQASLESGRFAQGRRTLLPIEQLHAVAHAPRTQIDHDTIPAGGPKKGPYIQRMGRMPAARFIQPGQ